MTADNIKNEWESNGKISRDLGTSLHEDIEKYYNDIEVENSSKEYEYFLNFVKEHEELKIYRTEWFIFSEIFRITGAIDAVFENDDGTLSIYDWKRSKDISFNAFNNECANYPIEHIPNTNYYQYSLQLNLYKAILEKYYGKKIKDLCLVILHPNNLNYEIIKVKNMKEEIELILQDRMEYLNSKKIQNKTYNSSEKQQDALNKMKNGDNIFLTGAGGVGKCLGFGTEIIMYDGSIERVENIKPGDILMGDDSEPRKVLSTTNGVRSRFCNALRCWMGEINDSLCTGASSSYS